MRVTADAKEGSVSVAVLGAGGRRLASGQLSGKDVTDAAVAFERGADLRALRGRAVRLEFVMRKAKLYSFAVGREGAAGKAANDRGKGQVRRSETLKGLFDAAAVVR